MLRFVVLRVFERNILVSGLGYIFIPTNIKILGRMSPLLPLSVDVGGEMIWLYRTS